ncbi:MAG: FecR family protein [Flavobacteriales bacterium]
MNKHTEHIDELCARVLLGEASAQEEQELNVWRELSGENESYFQELERAFEQSGQIAPQITVDVDAAWNKVRSRINSAQRETPVIPLRKKSGLVWKIAAAVVVLIGVSIVLFQLSGSKEESYALQSFDEAVRDTLNDGTIAVLNANSQLTYAFNEKEKSRKVVLKGEAYFEIKHSDSLSFTVQSDELMIRDIGTAFNVDAPPNSDTIRVFVREGIVELYTVDQKGIRIQEGETGFYVKSKKEFGTLKQNEDVNPDTYATGDFRFRNTRLEKVVRKLNEYFHVDISLDSPEMKSCPWSIHLLDSDLDTILGVFAETFEFTVERAGDKIVLKGGTCQDFEE